MNLYEFREEPQRNTRNPIVKGERRLYTLTGPARRAAMLSLGDSCFRRRRGRCRRKGYNHRRRLARNWLVDCILSCLDGTWPKATTTHAVPSIFLAEDGGQGENAQDTNAQNTKEGP